MNAKLFCITVTVILLLAGTFAFAPRPALAAYSCTSQAPGNWSNAATWTNCNSTYPQNGDDVSIAAGHTVTLDTDTAALASLQIAGGATLVANGNITVSGNWTNNGGTFTPNSYTVTFNGSSAQTIGGTTITQTFCNLALSNTSGGVGVGGSTTTLTLSGALNITTGSFAAANLNVAGNWTNNGTFTHNNGTVTFNGSSGTQTISGSTTFYNLTLANTGATTSFGTSSTTIANALSATAGTMSNAGTASTVTFTGSSGSITGGSAKRFYNLVINSGANISHSGGSLLIKGNFTNNGTFTQNSSLETTFDATISTHSLSGSGITTFGSITINGSTTVNAGTHNPTVTGSDFAVTGTFNGGTATVTFNSSTTLGGSGTISFNNVTINATKSLINNTNNKNFSVSGNWTNNGTYTAGTETVTFNKSGTQTFTGSTAFNNVTVNTGSTLQLTADANFGYKGTFTLNGSFDTTTNSPTTVTIAGTSAQSLPAGATTLRNLVINSGSSLTAPSGNLSIAGNFTNNGTFTHNNGTVTFNGSGAQAISGATTFYDLTIDNTATTPGDDTDVDSDAAVTMESTLTVNDGQFQPPTGSVFIDVTIGTNGILKPDAGASIDVFSDWTNNGTFTHNSGTLNFCDTTMSGSSTTSLYNMTTDTGCLPVLPSGNLNVAGNWTDTDGNFLHNNGTVTFNGSGDQTISSNATSQIFYNLAVNKSGGTLSVGGSVSSISVNGSFTLTSGTFSAPATLTVSGDWTHSGGTFTPGTGTITFDKSGTQTFAGSTIFNSVTVATGSTLRLAANADFGYKSTFELYGTFDATANSPTTVTIAGTSAQSLPTGATTLRSLTINSGGSLTAPGDNLNLAGNWTNNGTFTHNSGKVTFNGSGTSTFGGSSSTSFYDLEISSDTTLDVSTNTLFNATNSVRNYGKLKQTQTVGTGNAAFLNVSSGKYYGVELDPEGSTSMGSTTVTIYGEQNCPTPPSLGVAAVKRCWDIAPTTATATTVKFWYDNANELNGNTASSVKMYHVQDGLWYTENGTYTRSSSGGFESVQVTGVSSFSRFAATSNTPTAPTLIALSSFTATPTVSGVVLAWQTASELDTAGFNLWRSETPDGGYRKINPALIPAAGGPTWGASYTFTDVAVVAGATCYYKLEEVDVYGLSAFHGPTAVTPGMAQGRRYLPLMGR